MTIRTMLKVLFIFGLGSVLGASFVHFSNRESLLVEIIFALAGGFWFLVIWALNNVSSRDIENCNRTEEMVERYKRNVERNKK